MGMITSSEQARRMQRASAAARERNRQRRAAITDLARAEHLMVELEALVAGLTQAAERNRGFESAAEIIDRARKAGAR